MDSAFLALLVGAFAVGALHALEPGHGKTVVAAYLIGSKGTVADAALLGGVVTLTHTFSVYLLAAASVLLVSYLAQEQVHYWLSVASGLLVLAVGLALLAVRLRGRQAGRHEHAHQEHNHPHPDHHEQGRVEMRDGLRVRVVEHDGHTHVMPEAKVGLGALVALGVSGGIVPCPAALALIPAALSLGKLLQGLSLVLAFSLGLALVLIAIGIFTVKGFGAAARYLRADNARLTRRLALASALFISLLGALLTAKALWFPEPFAP